MANTKKQPTGRRPVLLTYLFKTLQQALRARAEEPLRELGVSLPQLGVLRVLLHEPGASNAALARFAFVAPQSMAELLAALEQRGLILREPDPDHARIVLRRLTPAGASVAQQGLALVLGVEQQMLAGFSPKERDQLRALLERCVAGLSGDPAP
jgi:DNA-binding MarR family transcriptional regulator